MIWGFIKERGKAFMASFVTGVVAAFFTSLRSAGLPVDPAWETSISMFIVGLFVTQTANSVPARFVSNGWGSHFKEWVLQLINALIGFFLTKLGMGAVT